MNSMTGFGRASFSVSGRSFRLELRSVNNRFLDVRATLPWADVSVEHALRAKIGERLARGRVDVTVSADEADSGVALQLNAAAAKRLAGLIDSLANELGGDRHLAARLLPPQRDLLTTRVAADATGLWEGLEPCLDQAIDALLEMRAAEGRVLHADLQARLQHTRELAADIERAVDGEVERRSTKLKERLDRLVADEKIDRGRLHQEVAILADRSDISEEVVRIASHLGQLAEMLQVDEPVGRRIEFMLQELNREFNTIASKTASADVARQVVDAKSTLEKMREQAQNVE
ncbi:MAG: YicC family protein [Deltaproteobacteria bacterium]|nr:YicC family protein [Deltaproteobacteria bacterium]